MGKEAAAGVGVGLCIQTCVGLCTYSFIFVLFIVPVNVVAIVLGAVWKETCESQPIDLGIWLIVLGAVGIGVGILGSCIFIATPCTVCFGIIVCICAEAFQIAWVVVGGICIWGQPGFDDCYGEAVWITAIVFWCLSVLGLVFYTVNCCLGGCNTCLSSMQSLLACCGIISSKE